ncbi:MAG: shikimate dehydrogenase, partial [Pelagibacterales bacterium]|nr:shikimate dehydrogenase [Pelagibacterales bacterium]
NKIRGINVTVPFKREVMPYLDEITEDALALGAVNTIKVGEKNKLFGFNTDAYGFMQHLTMTAPHWKEKKGAITVIGAGGASRAVIWSFLKENKNEIRIVNRNKKRALSLIEDMHKLFPEAHIIFCKESNEALLNSALLVNCSSLGMKGQPDLEVCLEKMNKEAIIYDIVYNPLQTKLLDKAKALNLTSIDGIGMLLNQAAPAFELWYNKKVIVTDTLRNKVIEHLGRS